MDKAAIPFLPVSELAELIKNHELSPVEVVESYLDRIDILNDRLYAYLTVCHDEALQAARESERALAQGGNTGPLHGVPVAVKDQINTAGIRTTSGTPIFSDFVPDEDATVIAKLKSAGAILLGKLNMTEFGTRWLSKGGGKPQVILGEETSDITGYSLEVLQGKKVSRCAALSSSLQESPGGRFKELWRRCSTGPACPVIYAPGEPRRPQDAEGSGQ